MYGSVMALHKHFGYTCGATEIAVDLERRMCVEHVGVCASVLILDGDIRVFEFQLVSDKSICVVAVKQTCP